MQFGSAWWFLDQLDGMEKQMNALSNMGLLSRFVGMLTDSRSFLSYSRHDYFRRLLCNLLGNDVEAGRLPARARAAGQAGRRRLLRQRARLLRLQRLAAPLDTAVCGGSGAWWPPRTSPTCYGARLGAVGGPT